MVLEALLSTAFPQLSGNLISNQPKNEKAKTASRRKRMMLNTALVLSAFRVLGPAMAVTARPKIASRIPFFLSFLARFRKKLTVIGIIGQMQGMTSASRPPTKPMKKM
ncbi:Uncharacterised protein [Segatella copri]|nr:Uncharacterised protein [Segatella copri]